MFRNIVVGFGGSAPSENALRVVCEIAQNYDATNHRLHTSCYERVVSPWGPLLAITWRPPSMPHVPA